MNSVWNRLKCLLHALDLTAMWFKTQVTRKVKPSLQSQNRQMTRLSYLNWYLLMAGRKNVIFYRQYILTYNIQVFWFALTPNNMQVLQKEYAWYLIPLPLRKALALELKMVPCCCTETVSMSKMSSTNFSWTQYNLKLISEPRQVKYETTTDILYEHTNSTYK